jgi:hypothetical protein
MSRHGSIFYDAPEALSVLILNEDKDEIEKMVRTPPDKVHNLPPRRTNSTKLFKDDLVMRYLYLRPVSNFDVVLKIYSDISALIWSWMVSLEFLSYGIVATERVLYGKSLLETVDVAR